MIIKLTCLWESLKYAGTVIDQKEESALKHVKLDPNKYSHWFSVGKHFILMLISNKYTFKRDFVLHYLFSLWKISVLLFFQ